MDALQVRRVEDAAMEQCSYGVNDQPTCPTSPLVAYVPLRHSSTHLRGCWGLGTGGILEGVHHLHRGGPYC